METDFLSNAILSDERNKIFLLVLMETIIQIKVKPFPISYRVISLLQLETIFYLFVYIYIYIYIYIYMYVPAGESSFWHGENVFF